MNRLEEIMTHIQKLRDLTSTGNNGKWVVDGDDIVDAHSGEVVASNLYHNDARFITGVWEVVPELAQQIEKVLEDSAIMSELLSESYHGDDTALDDAMNEMRQIMFGQIQGNHD